MTILVDDVLKGGVEWSLGTEKGMIVRHYKVTTVLNPDEVTFMEGLVAEIAAEAQVVTDAICAIDTIFVCATLQKVGITAPTRIYTFYGAGGPVTATAAAKGAQQAVLASLYPNAGELLKSGRNYFPFLRGDFSAEGQITGIAQGGLLTEISKLIFDTLSVVSIGDIKPIIYRALGEIAVDITSIVLRAVIATQQRRVNHHQTFG